MPSCRARCGFSPTNATGSAPHRTRGGGGIQPRRGESGRARIRQGEPPSLLCEGAGELELRLDRPDPTRPNPRRGCARTTGILILKCARCYCDICDHEPWGIIPPPGVLHIPLGQERCASFPLACRLGFWNGNLGLQVEADSNKERPAHHAQPAQSQVLHLTAISVLKSPHCLQSAFDFTQFSSLPADSFH